MQFVFWLLALTLLYTVAAHRSSSNVISTEARVPQLPDGRIVGGRPATIDEFPHQVSLRFFGNHFCGGSILSDKIIITAAHCLTDSTPDQLTVIAGSSYTNGENGSSANVKNTFVHENYNSDRNEYDVGIVVLSDPLPLNDKTIRTISLADSGPNPSDNASVTGYGATSYDGSLPNQLQEVVVPIIADDDCNKDYDGQITQSMVCAGYRGVGGKDACQGDSGGPLIVNGRLAGIVSWGYGCARPQYPGVYSKISYLRPWIDKTVKGING